MEKSIGRIWVSLAILAVATFIWLQGDALKVILNKSDEVPS